MLEHLTIALTEAIQDEYKARATYRAIIEQFGPVRPFVNILAAEERHIQALTPLFVKYYIPIPTDDWAVRVGAPISLDQACKDGVQAEIENGEMYERLLVMVADYPDVQRVFRQLQRASQENHLPTFQRCAAREQRGRIRPGYMNVRSQDSHRSASHGCSNPHLERVHAEILEFTSRGCRRRRRRGFRRGRLARNCTGL